MQLTVLLDAPRARTSDEFLIRDLPGTSGRLDVVCRVLISTYRSVPRLAPFIQFYAVLGGSPNPPLQLHVNNLQVEYVPESELACALIMKTLLFLYRTKKVSQVSPWPEFSLHPKNFEDTLKEIWPSSPQCLYLVEEGDPLDQVILDLSRPILLILGDDKGLRSDHEAVILQHPVQRVSMGTRSLLGSQVISLFLLEFANRLEQDVSPQGMMPNR
ncbi:MAG: hypothetical protein ACFE89_05450 [Candidatus Hodarchaeota archaeon]